MENKNEVEHFDPNITLTFTFPSDLNSYYRKAVQKSIRNNMVRMGAKQTLSENVDEISFEIQMSRFPFAIEQMRHWYSLGAANWK